MCLHFSSKPLLKKIKKIRSSLTLHQSKKYKICVRISKTNIWLQLPLRSNEKQPCRNICKTNSSSEAAIKMYFSISLFCNCGEIPWKIPVMEWHLGKFACNTLQLWTTAAEKLNFSTALNDAEQQLLQNTSKKLLLCLEAVSCRCSSK